MLLWQGFNGSRNYDPKVCLRIKISSEDRWILWGSRISTGFAGYGGSMATGSQIEEGDDRFANMMFTRLDSCFSTYYDTK
jgi:antibiotic biosynthesis monooxygenase (ABM) superfamily enzyme